MENNTTQRESRLVLYILGGLIVCLCLTLIGAGYLLTTQSQEIVNAFQTQVPVRRPPYEMTETAVAANATVAIATRAAQQTQPLIFNETFDSNTNEWDIADFEDDYFSNRERIADGVLSIQSTAKKGFFALRTPKVKELEDFFASAKVRQVKGPTGKRFGIAFRVADGGNFFWFGIDQNQKYSVSMKYKGEWETVVPRQFSRAIETQGVNQLAVSGHGSQFDLFINDVYVDSFEDSRLARGRIGIGFELSAQDETLLEFDNVKVHGAPTQKDQNAQATVTAWAPTLTARANWQVIMADGFEKTSNPEGWYTGNVNTERTVGSRKVEEGVYRWKLRALQGTTWYSIPRNPKFQDFRLSIDAYKIGGGPTSFYCAAFRIVDSDNYYRFCVKETQEFKVDGRFKGKWTTIVDWTDSPAIRASETNRLSVSGVGSHFVFEINDQYVWDLEDYRLTYGTPGVAIEMGQGDETTFEFDNFALQRPTLPTPTPSRPGTASHTHTLTLTPTQTETPNAAAKTLTAAAPTATAIPSLTRFPTSTAPFVDVPNLLFYSPERALELLEAIGLRGEVEVESSTYCGGLLKRQDPIFGTQLPRGSIVRIVSCRPLTPTPKP